MKMGYLLILAQHFKALVLEKVLNCLGTAAISFKVMADDLFAATKYKLRVTSAFINLNNAIKNFKQKYSPTPWLRKYDRRYPAYFADKPEWRRNGKLFVNNHEFPIVSATPVLEDGVSRYSSAYGGNFVGNDYIKYWWPNSLYPNDSGKWWYKKQSYSKVGDAPVATPGLSNHGWGISVDLHQDISNNKKAIDWMANNMLQYGWSRESLPDDQWHITYHIVAFATPLVTGKIENLKKASVIKPSLNKVSPSIASTTKKVSSTPALTSLPVKQIIVNKNNDSATPNFYVPNSSNSVSNNFLGSFERALQVSIDLAAEIIFKRHELFGAEDTRTKLDVFADLSGLRGPAYQLDAIDKAITVKNLNFIFKLLTTGSVFNPLIPTDIFPREFRERIGPEVGSTTSGNSKYFSTDFNVPMRKSSTSFQVGGGAFGRQATVTSSKFTVLPGLKNLDGLSPKIFKVAKPYNGSSDPGDFLTYDEFFEMMIHPLVGNFSFGLAAVFTALASREGNLGENKIGIGVANGSEHLGFLQIRCKPEDTNSFDPKNGWLGTSMLWSVPYTVTGEADLTKNNKKYAWEAFIKDENIIKDIKGKASSPSKASQASALSLININTPAFSGNYDVADRKNAASYLADWARIPANQVWMMKSKFSLPSNYLDKQLTNIQLPYIPQVSVMKQIDKPWNVRGVGFMFNPWNISGENTWKQGADVNVAFNVLVNWFKKYGVFSQNGSKPTQVQSETRALKELADLSSYMETGKKKSFNSWLLGID